MSLKILIWKYFYHLSFSPIDLLENISGFIISCHGFRGIDLSSRYKSACIFGYYRLGVLHLLY